MTDDVQNNGTAMATDDHAAIADQPQTDAASDGSTSHYADLPTPQGGFAKLVLKRSGAETDIEFPLNPPSIAGRFDPAVGPIDVDLGSLPEGSYVSRKHAKFTYEDGVWRVTDLGSSNGTFVLNDDFERVETADLRDGQEVALGNARFVFHLTPASAAGTAD
ncbi:FHA domain-containing protein [Fimbriimonas ginsengisoli]|uniref:FraH-related protein n=1 Tax=Fimbriimonas ginsengisoli Gsoil 348 TaxID=661478 RepID=A0A068NK71_FIMGI|nr:FHA domain-containing protein [Fimbriimonas ginsengisoli]AIE83852.1 FraH-related protein [Fimbriimonas ginsengisoli Gsoil 348]